MLPAEKNAVTAACAGATNVTPATSAEMNVRQTFLSIAELPRWITAIFRKQIFNSKTLNTQLYPVYHGIAKPDRPLTCKISAEVMEPLAFKS